jgi:DNA-binding CsgD family transcriptional regulator
LRNRNSVGGPTQNTNAGEGELAMTRNEDELNALVDLIYDTPLVPERWTQVNAGLERLSRGRVAFLAQDERPTGFFMPCSEAGGPDVAEYLDRHWSTDLAMRHLRTAPAGGSVVDSRLVSDDGRQRLGFYRDYLAPRGLHRGYYTVVCRDDDGATVMGVHRPDRNDDFEEDCTRAIAFVRPHLGRAIRLAKRLSAAETVRDASLSAMDEAGLGLIVLSRDGVARFVNRLGEAQLAAGILSARCGRWVAAQAVEDRAMQAALSGATRSIGAVATTFSLTDRRGIPVKVTAMPLRPDDFMHLGSEPLAMLIFGAPASDLNVEALRETYGLTASEARLFKAVASGERVSEYAVRVGVQLTTAKTHLRSVFAKTGLQRQADLVRLALCGSSPPPRLDRAA